MANNKKSAPKVNKLLMTSLAEYFFSVFLRRDDDDDEGGDDDYEGCDGGDDGNDTLSLSVSFDDDEVTRHIPGIFATSSHLFSRYPTKGSQSSHCHVLSCAVYIKFDFSPFFFQLSEGDPGTHRTTLVHAPFNYLTTLFFQ